jgi:hypothetical protein
MTIEMRPDSRDHLILNQSGRYHFKELEMLILDHLTKSGHLQPGIATGKDADRVHIGNMVIDLIMLAENLGLDLTDCMAAAYIARTGERK